jgi:hypothetical protein
MSNLAALMAATHVYVGRKPCGCIVAVVVDTQDKQTGKDVGKFIANGLAVERMTNEAFEAVKAGCACGKVGAKGA